MKTIYMYMKLFFYDNRIGFHGHSQFRELNDREEKRCIPVTGLIMP
jgi:hypothetical protein